MTEKREAHCWVCGCTELDCRGCTERLGEPCQWEGDGRKLCTACAPLLTMPVHVVMMARYLPGLARNRFLHLRAACTTEGIMTVGNLLVANSARLNRAMRLAGSTTRIAPGIGRRLRLAARRYLDAMTEVGPMGATEEQINAAQGLFSAATVSAR